MKWIFNLLFGATCFGALAQTTFHSLQECVDFGRQNNPALKSELLNEEVSQERVKVAWALLLPQVKAFGSFDNNVSLPVNLIPAQLLGGPEGEYIRIKFGTRYNANFGAEASLSLVNVSNWKNVKSAALGEEAARFQVKDRKLSVTEQIITSYYFTLLSGEAIVLNQELVTSADSLLKAADIRLTNGMIEPLEYNRVKAIYLETFQELRESQGALQKNSDALKALCGLHETDSLVLTERIATQKIQEVAPVPLNIAAQQLPRYKMLATRASQSHIDLVKQRARVLPELSMFARVSRQSFSNELNFFSDSQPWYDVSVVGFRAEWNLFTGFNRHASIRQASLQQQIATQDLTNYALQSEKELEELRINHRLAAEGLERYAEHFRINAANNRIAGEKYRQGIYTIDQYVTIYQETVRSQTLYLNKLANYLIYESMVQSRNGLN